MVPPPGSDLVTLLVLTVVFLMLLIGTEAAARTGHLGPELSRKTIHVAGGLVCALFPWLFRSPLTVFALAFGMSALFALGHRGDFLRSLHRVQRSTRGSEYYPLAIFLAFLFSAGKPWLYVAAVLVLACADAGAALVGSRFGRHRYTVDWEEKSVEGSLMFLVIALLGLALPLLVLSPLSTPNALWSSLLVALLMTGVEAIARQGRDNFFVPVGVVLILGKITSKPLAEIIYQNLSLLGLMAIVFVLANRTRTLNAGAAIAVLLLLYGSWSLGSELWALPVFCAFLLFLFSRLTFLRGLSPFRSARVVRGLTGPAVALLAGNLLVEYDLFFGPFVVAITGIAAAFLRNQRVPAMTAGSVLMVFLPAYLVAGPPGVVAPGVALAMLLVQAIAVARVAPEYDELPLARMGTGLVAAMLGAQLLGLPAWHG